MTPFNHELAVAHLELAAAKTKQVALDYKTNRMWPGDLQRGIAEINEYLRLANSAAGDFK